MLRQQTPCGIVIIITVFNIIIPNFIVLLKSKLHKGSIYKYFFNHP
jgi:hypothetical protein